jgi:hypothetical protein
MTENEVVEKGGNKHMQFPKLQSLASGNCLLFRRPAGDRLMLLAVG